MIDVSELGKTKKPVWYNEKVLVDYFVTKVEFNQLKKELMSNLQEIYRRLDAIEYALEL